VFWLWFSIYFFPCMHIVNCCCSYIFLLMFSSITAVYCRAERRPHIDVTFKMKDLAAFLEIHMWITRVTLFSFRTFCDKTQSKCVYLKRRHKREEVRHDVWGPSFSVTLHRGCWTWSLSDLLNKQYKVGRFLWNVNQLPADYASPHHTRNYSLKSILMYANFV
jgi:hypothetical protein